MKLLIVTQRLDMDDPILGFFHGWIIKFSEHFESIVVICLYKGECMLPSNVKVFSLGKENNISRLGYIINFYKYIWLERRNYDRVFIHMNQIYVLLGAMFWKLFGKEIFLWYTHKSVTISLRIATIFVSKIFSASKESFRIKTKKLQVIGHGIDIDLFSFDDNKRFDSKGLKLITVGRISESKDLVTIVRAIDILKNKYPLQLEVIGSPLTQIDTVYFNSLKKQVSTNVDFLGSKPQLEIISFLKKADLFIHASQTGSLDKAPLEAMACGTPVVSCNDSLVPFLISHNLVFKNKDVDSLAQVIESYILNSQKDKIRLQLRDTVMKGHSLIRLIDNLSKEIIHE
jgi:glycosyltransferase involved in cell wall biosynthesis